MKVVKKVETFEIQDEKWQSPINISKYNRSPYLTNSEKEELTIVLNKKSTWFKKSYLILDRLLRPLHDCLDYIKASKPDRVRTVRWIFLEMEKRKTSFWAWSNKEWYEIFSNSDILGYQAVTNRPTIMSIAYLLDETFEYHPLKITHHIKLAKRIFGDNLVQESLDLLHNEYIALGYGTQLSKYHIPGTFCYILLANRSPFIREITTNVLNKCKANSNSEIVHRNLVQISRVLTNLEIISKPLKLKSEYRKKTEDTLEGIAPEWVEWCQRWLNTSTLVARKKIYYENLKIGRWLAQNYPEIVTPEHEYFKRNLRTVEVLIDQDAIITGAVTNGEPWKYYDLGHGLCTYDFFSQCKHRMACAGCGFYIPKGSSKAQIIEAKGNLERMLQEIPLTEEEEFAVTEGIEALAKLKEKLADVPTPTGKTPKQIEEEKKGA